MFGFGLDGELVCIMEVGWTAVMSGNTHTSIYKRRAQDSGYKKDATGVHDYTHIWDATNSMLPHTFAGCYVIKLDHR